MIKEEVLVGLDVLKDTVQVKKIRFQAACVHK